MSRPPGTDESLPCSPFGWQQGFSEGPCLRVATSQQSPWARCAGLVPGHMLAGCPRALPARGTFTPASCTATTR
eukprot:1969306-Alexandrium_andersonii.AAC.1